MGRENASGGFWQKTDASWALSLETRKKKIIPGNESQVVKIEGLSSPFLPRAVGKLHLPALMSLLWGKKKNAMHLFSVVCKMQNKSRKKKESKFY